MRFLLPAFDRQSCTHLLYGMPGTGWAGKNPIKWNYKIILFLTRLNYERLRRNLVWPATCTEVEKTGAPVAKWPSPI